MPHRQMEWLIEKLLRVRPASWAQGGRVNVELLSMPRHDVLLLALAVVGAGIWGVWWLYQREGRTISTRVRIMLAVLRVVVLASILLMLLEPVLVFSRNEYVPSTLIVLKDISDSMGLRDAWSDNVQAEKVATALALPGGAGELRQTTRTQLANRVVNPAMLEKLARAG